MTIRYFEMKNILDFSLPRNIVGDSQEAKEIIFKKRLIQTDFGNPVKIGDMGYDEYFDFVVERVNDLLNSIRKLTKPTLIIQGMQEESFSDAENDDRFIVFKISINKKYNHDDDFVKNNLGISLEREFSDIVLLLDGNFENGRKINYFFDFFGLIEKDGWLPREKGLFRCIFGEISEKFNGIDFQSIKIDSIDPEDEEIN